MEAIVQLVALVLLPLVGVVLQGAVFAATVILVARKMGVKF